MRRRWLAARTGVYKSGKTRVQTEADKRHGLAAAALVLERPIVRIEPGALRRGPKFTRAERRAWKRRDRSAVV